MNEADIYENEVRKTKGLPPLVDEGQTAKHTREKFKWIYENHHPEPLEASVQKELNRILEHASRELA